MSLREAVEKYKTGGHKVHRTPAVTGPRTRVVMELTGSTHACLPGQALEVYDLSSRRVVGDGYTLRLVTAGVDEEDRLATPDHMWDPQDLRLALDSGRADPEDLVSAPGGVWDLSPDQYFTPGLHLSSQPGAGGGTQCYQRPLTLGDYPEVFDPARSLVPFQAPYWAIEDANGTPAYLPERARMVRLRRVDIPFTMSPVDRWKPFAKIKWSGCGGGLNWVVQADKAINGSRRGRLYLVRPGPADLQTVTVSQFWDGTETVDYTVSEIPAAPGERYPRCGTQPTEVIRWYNGDRPLTREYSRLTRGCKAGLRAQANAK